MTSRQLNELHQIASKKTQNRFPDLDNSLVEESLAYLASRKAIESVECDPYWPKWDSPWWHMLLLHEMGLTSRIPENIVESIISALNNYLKFFPFTEADVPAGFNPLNQVACHCQLGTIHQLLIDYGIDVDDRLAWLNPWYIRYQLNDGGLNCDEAAYTKATRKSSVVSTLPPLEAVLMSKKQLTAEQIRFLDLGAAYLIQKRLWRSSSTGLPINSEWHKLCFPRFYHYDVLRGLSFILTWSRKLMRPLPINTIYECVQRINAEFPDGHIRVQRSAWSGADTRYLNRSTNLWERSAATSFPLLNAMSEPDTSSAFLTQDWTNARATLLTLIEEGLIEIDSADAITAGITKT